jgi:hypothetical protein
VVQKRFTRDRSDSSKSQLWPRPQRDEPRNGEEKVDCTLLAGPMLVASSYQRSYDPLTIRE